MAIIVANPTIYFLQGDGVSTSVDVTNSWCATSVLLVSQFSVSTVATGSILQAITNVTGVSIINNVLTVTFAAPFSYLLQLTVNYTPIPVSVATVPISQVAQPLPANASQESGGNLSTIAGEVAAGTINSTGQVSVGVSATQIIAANAARKGVLIFNAGSVTVYIGAAGVTTATGHILPAGASLSLPTVSAIYGISTTSQIVSVMELQ